VNYSYMLMLDRKTNEQSACSLEKILVIFLWILGPTPTFDIEPFLWILGPTTTFDIEPKKAGGISIPSGFLCSLL
ncbi:MAG: hypothetical protein ACOYJU_06240, partial [Anaerovoracaceae bacterium]